MVINGGCLCGLVRYEIAGPLFSVEHCHCSMCRRQHGAAFATYAEFNPGTFRWSAGEDLVKMYNAVSGGGWCFCNECGSTLAGADNGKIISVALGTVESELELKPEFHIFVGSKAQWHEICDDLPQFEERPPDGWEPPSTAP